MVSCLAVVAVTAALSGPEPYLYDGDTVTRWGPPPSARLTTEAGPFDTPEINGEAGCPEEHEMGVQARERTRELMPGRLCIIGTDGAGAHGRDLAILYGRDGRDVGAVLLDERLAAASEPFDWCTILR